MLELEKAFVVWMTGLSGAGKTTLCQSVAKRLHADCHKVIILDGDVIREGLCSDLGFSTEDRIESVRRIAHVAKLFASNGTTVLVAVMAPIEAARPTMKAYRLLSVANAAANTGASVETEPSIKPARPGCTICRTKRRRSESSSFSRAPEVRCFSSIASARS